MTRARLTPRDEALAYRIWGHALPLGWNLTAAELAEALDVALRRVERVVAAKGWGSRLRTTRRAYGGAGMTAFVDEFLGGVA